MDPRSGGPGSPFGYPFSMPAGPYPYHPQMGLDPRISDPRYNWDPARIMGFSPHHNGSPVFGEIPFGRLPPDSGRSSDAAFLHPAYRMSQTLWEQMYRTFQANSLRGMPFDGRGPMSPDQQAAYLRHSAGLPPPAGSDIFSMHPASATPSIGIPFSTEGSRIATPRPSSLSRSGKKRPLSISPFGQEFDLNTVIRMSPNSLISGGNGSRCSSSASGTYGHLAAGTISPSMPVDPVRLQQLQQYMMRHNPQSFFPSAFYPPAISKLSIHSPMGTNSQDDQQMESPAGKRVCDSKHREPSGHGVVSSSVNPVDQNRKEKVKKEPAQSTSTVDGDEDDGHCTPGRNSPDDFIETHCRWSGCDLDFQTPKELVEHVNEDHLKPQRKFPFVCRWSDCCREEKPFKAQYMLVVHMRRHTGEKPHQCKFSGCHKAYSRLENLKTHERSHTGERPYNCEFPGCQKAFSNASDRAKHQNRTHSNAKPYSCKFPNCTKRYTDPSSLRKHVKTVHGTEYMNNKRHKANDVPRRHRGDDDGNGQKGGGDESTRSSKSFSESEPSTPRGNVKQESLDRSPSYSMPPSVFSNCPQDSPASMDYHMQNHTTMPSLNTRSNAPIVEEENEFDLIDLSGPFDGPQLMPSIRPTRYSVPSCPSLKPPPPPSAAAISMTYRPPGTGEPVNMSDLSDRFTEMRTILEPRDQYFVPTQQDSRRDSNVSMSSAYYSSVPSDSSHTLSAYPSRRASDAAMMPMNYVPEASPPYDPISVGSSRRSSEPGLAGTLSGYQQKMQMRAQQNASNWQPAAQQQSGPCPTGPPGNGQYHGARRASAPVLPVSLPPRTQPLTRRNLLRHNSLSANSTAPPMFSNNGFLNFEENPIDDFEEQPESNQLFISEDIVRHLEQYGAAHRMDDHDDDDGDLLPIIQQNYTEGLNQAYMEPLPPPPPVFTGYPPPPNIYDHDLQKRASFDCGYSQPQPGTSRRLSGASEYYPQNPVYNRQRRASLQVSFPVNVPRPLTEGSPDSYEVTSTTNDGRFSGYEEYPANGNARSLMPGNNEGVGGGMVVTDMHTMMNTLDHENQFLKMIQ